MPTYFPPTLYMYIDKDITFHDVGDFADVLGFL
jgi:hypothetical protein